MKLIRKNNKEGFTLVELIVVIAILAILALILIPAITGYIEKSNRSSLEASARALYSQAALEVAENDDLDLDKLDSGKYVIAFEEDFDDADGTYKVSIVKKAGDADKAYFDQDGDITNNWDTETP